VKKDRRLKEMEEERISVKNKAINNLQGHFKENTNKVAQ
jgi:hypothetical protein